jgi:hypothetical protein
MIKTTTTTTKSNRRARRGTATQYPRKGKFFGDSGRSYPEITTGLSAKPQSFPVSQNKRIDFKYFDAFLLGDSTLAQKSILFNGNAPYDPDATYTGHQPLGYDQWSTFYDRYSVRQTAITVKISNQSSNSVLVALVAYKGQAPSVVSTIIEQPYSVWDLLAPGGDSRTTLSLDASSQNMFGGTAMLMDDTYTSTMGGVPSERWYFQLTISVPGGSALGSSAVTVAIEINYDTLLYVPKPLAGS